MTTAAEPPDAAEGGERTVIDAHVHFWDPRHLSYPWLAGAPALNRPRTPDHLLAALPEPIEAIFVEAGAAAHDAQDEIERVRRAAGTHAWIRGAVVHIPLEQPDLAQRAIRRYGADPLAVGVRRNLQDEAAGFSADAHFRAGVQMLGEAGLPFDACVRDHQLPELAELAAACPQTTIVLDHAGKPRSAQIEGTAAWRGALARLAERSNVVCKLSGLSTELPAGTSTARTVDMVRTALDIFGPWRCLYGSDWPVMTLATDYGAWLDLVRDALSAYPAADARAVLRANTQRIYGLDHTATPPGTPSKESA